MSTGLPHGGLQAGGPGAAGLSGPSGLPGSARHRLRLRRLRLRDFRGLAHLELDLSYLDGAPLDVVVLRGGAGAGKTAVLEAVLLLLEVQELLGAGGLGEPRRQVRWGAAACELAAELVLLPPEPGPARRLGASLRIEAGALSMWTLPGTERRALDGVPAVPGSVLPWPPRGRIAYLPADRHTPFDEPLLRLFQRSQRHAETTDGRPLPQLQALQALWQQLDPRRRQLRLLRREPRGADLVVVCDPALPAEVTSLAQATQAIGRSRHGALPCVLPLEQLSHAERAVLGLGTTLCARELPPDLVLLDAPELQLPPDWQARLLPALRGVVPQAQLIVASHAEPIATSVLAYERLALA